MFDYSLLEKERGGNMGRWGEILHWKERKETFFPL
jgi:hypothetical protein